MIRGVHAMFYSAEPEALREFLRDKLRLPYTDVGGGWLIFDVPEADVGCHPTNHAGNPPSGTHDVSFYCDDIEKTVAELKGRGVAFLDDISDQGYGLTIHFVMPGDVKVELYQPHYQKPADTHRETIENFLRCYARALVASDMAALIGSYALPALVLSDDGARELTARFQVEELFAEMFARYKDQGIVDMVPEIRKLEPLSEHLVSLDVHWEHLGPEARVMSVENTRYVLTIDAAERVHIRSTTTLKR